MKLGSDSFIKGIHFKHIDLVYYIWIFNPNILGPSIVFKSRAQSTGDPDLHLHVISLCVTLMEIKKTYARPKLLQGPIARNVRGAQAPKNRIINNHSSIEN